MPARKLVGYDARSRIVQQSALNQDAAGPVNFLTRRVNSCPQGPGPN